jgi:preprotein translocase subunit SecG
MTLAWILLILLLLVSMFLMLVILLQRGRGGGLAGAFGGLGGQSAFGTKAGDVFTVITVVTVTVWVLLACTAGWAVRRASEAYMEGEEEVETEAVDAAPPVKGGKKPAGDESESATAPGKSEKSDESKTDNAPGSGAAKTGETGSSGTESKPRDGKAPKDDSRDE